MKPQSQFETASHQYGKGHPDKISTTLDRRRAQAEARRQKELAARLREAAQLQTMIRDLAREVANLDDSIASELAISGAREPSRFGHPVSVTMMQARRDNLRTTIAALADRLPAVAPVVGVPGHGAATHIDPDHAGQE